MAKESKKSHKLVKKSNKIGNLSKRFRKYCKKDTNLWKKSNKVAHW